jgi:hypothetical protein
MMARFWIVGCAVVSLAACDDLPGMNSAPSDGFIQELPEGVLSIAAPDQDLTAVKIDPADGCYVYRYAGPVETTLLPLRTRDGRPICTQVATAPTSPAQT